LIQIKQLKSFNNYVEEIKKLAENHPEAFLALYTEAFNDGKSGYIKELIRADIQREKERG